MFRVAQHDKEDAILTLQLLTFRRFQSREEIVEQRVVNSAALGVILYSKSERVFAQPYLLDDAIMRGPRLHFQVVA